MRVLITGGFGYLGGRLARALATDSERDIVLGTRAPAGSPAWLPGARVVTMTWGSIPDLARACEGVDVVVHLAGLSADASEADPTLSRDVNGTYSERLALGAARAKVGRIIYASTARVYANPLAGEVTERSPTTSSHPYATSHRAGEEAILSAHARGDLAGVVVRLSNAYGPPAHPDAPCWELLVPDLARQAAVEGRMTLRTPGLQRRDFIPISEACRAVEHLMYVPGHALGEEPLFNVGGEWAPTVLEMALLIQDRCEAFAGRRPPLERPAGPADETTPNLEYRIERLRATGFAPSASRVQEIDDLLRCCRAWFRPNDP